MARRLSYAHSQRIDHVLGAWGNFVRRRAWPVLLASIALSVLLLVYAVQTLGISTSTEEMLSEDLPFRQADQRYTTLFPQYSGMMVVVVEGDNADLAEDAADRLAARLADEKQLFIEVFYANELEHFRRNGLLYLSEDRLVELADRLAQAQPLLAELDRDPSLRGLFDVLGLAVDEAAEGGGPTAGLDIAAARIAAVVEARADGREASLSWLELLDGDPPSEEDRRRLIVTRPWQDYDSLKPAGRAMDFVQTAAREMGLTPENGVRVRLTGSAAINSEELDSVAEGAALAGMLSLVLVAVLLVVGLRSGRLVVAVLATLIMGLIWTAAFAAAAIGTLNMISVAFAVLFIGLGVDFGIHYALRYREAIDHGTDRADAIRAASVGVGVSLVLSALAAAITFLSFVPTAYVGVSELGIIAGAGMFIALFTNLTVLPALLKVLRVAPDPGTGFWRRAGSAAERFVRTHRVGILSGAAVLGVAALALAPQARFDTDPLNLKDPSRQSVQAARDLQAASDAPYDTIKIVAQDREQAQALGERLEGLETVAEIITVDDLVPPNQQDRALIVEDMAFFMEPVFLGGGEAPLPDDAARRDALEGFQARLEAALTSGDTGALRPELERLHGAIEAYLAAPNADLGELEEALVGSLPPRLAALETSLRAEPFGLDDLPAQLRERYQAPGGQIRMEVVPADHLEGKRGLREFVQSVQDVVPEAIGSPVFELRAGDVIVDAFTDASLIALVAVTVLMLFVLGRPTDALLVMVPLALAAALTIAATVVLGMAFNFANIIVMPLLIGLGVASGIHLVVRARRELRTTVLSTYTPRAVVFSALTTVGSFGSLAVSGHRGTASMGELLMIAISFTLVCTLVVLPALMETRDRRRGRGIE